MYSWLDRDDFVPSRHVYPLRVDREAYCDEVMQWKPAARSRPRARSVRTWPKTVSVAATTGRTVVGPSIVPSAAVGGVAGTGRSRPIICAPEFHPVSATYSRWNANPPRKMTDEQARELY